MSATSFLSPPILPANSRPKSSQIQLKHTPLSKTRFLISIAASFSFPISQNSTRTLPSARTLLAKCSSEDSELPRMKDLLSGMVDNQVQELLNREENRVLLEGLEKASERVEVARKELLEIEKQEKEAKTLKDYIRMLESKEFQIAECRRELVDARAMVEEAEASLSSNMSKISSTEHPRGNEVVEMDKDKERFESVKAAGVSAIVGTLAGVPFSLSQVTNVSELFLHLGVIFISCALFGVTFRYTVRRDLNNIQLKTGTSAAFALVRGLAEVEAGPPLEFNGGSVLAHAFDGALDISQSLLIFIFAAIGLDYCFKLGLLSPFPIKKSV